MSYNDGIELFAPQAIGAISPEAVDGIVARTFVGQTYNQHSGPNAQHLINDLVYPIRGALRELVEIPDNHDVSVSTFSSVRTITHPGDIFLEGADFWHTDYTSPYEHFVLIADTSPTEVLSGEMSAEEVARLTRRHQPGVIVFEEIETALEGIRDDTKLPKSLGISQLRPYYGYLLGSQNVHRSPRSHHEEKIARGLIKITFKETAAER